MIVTAQITPAVRGHSLLHAALELAAGDVVLEPVGHAVQLGLGAAALPPADQLPTGQVEQLAPPKPGAQPACNAVGAHAS